MVDSTLWRVDSNGDIGHFGQATFQKGQVTESGGSLHITAQQQPDGSYQSGLIAAMSFSQAYGFWEVRAKAAPGHAMWPAFWMRDVIPVSRYEIDCPEWSGTNPTQVSWYTHDHQTNAVGSNRVTFPFDTTADYHVYGMDWEPDHVNYYVDGALVATSSYVPPAVTMHPMLDLAVGNTTWSWIGVIDATTPATSSLDVDYVRIWTSG